MLTFRRRPEPATIGYQHIRWVAMSALQSFSTYKSRGHTGIHAHQSRHIWTHYVVIALYRTRSLRAPLLVAQSKSPEAASGCAYSLARTRSSGPSPSVGAVTLRNRDAVSGKFIPAAQIGIVCAATVLIPVDLCKQSCVIVSCGCRCQSVEQYMVAES